MATFRISTQATGYAMANSIFSGSSGFNASSTYIRIYKGALPVKNDLDTTAPSSLRTSDRLITFDFGSGDFTVSQPNGTATLNTSINANATASGTAAWFIIDVNSQFAPMIVGSVSGPGGGGDLVIGSTSITSGLTYSLGALVYTLPRVFT